MHLQQLTSLLELNKAGSFTKAAENLNMSQPNLSRSVRELEHELGFSIFERTPKGLLPTREGEELLARAEKIMAQVASIQTIGKQPGRQHALRVSVPRASYIATALTRFVRSLDPQQPVEIDYKETNAMRAIDNLLRKNYNLAIVRYSTLAESSFLSLFQEKGLRHEEIAAFSYRVLLSQAHPLAEKPRLTLPDLAPYVEVAHGDPYVPYLNYTQAKQAETFSQADRRICVYERGSQFDLLCDAPYTYMWVSPMPKHLLERYGLMCKPCEGLDRTYKDVALRLRGDRPGSLDQRFLEALRSTRDEVFAGA